MNYLRWADAVDQVRPYIFRIETPQSQGTGFLITHLANGKIGIATAFHVVSHSHEWDGPIRVTHFLSAQSVVLRPADRSVKAFFENDLAFLACEPGKLPVPDGPLSIAVGGGGFRQGVEIGWCGFPAVAPTELCFFRGHVSAYLDASKSYLVDGVAINGVSGSPAFVPKEEDAELQLCGVVTAYVPNRATGETLPGVCWVQDLSPYSSDYIPF